MSTGSSRSASPGRQEQEEFIRELRSEFGLTNRRIKMPEVFRAPARRFLPDLDSLNPA